MKHLLALILIASLLLLNGAINVSAASDQKRHEEHQSETSEQKEKRADQQPVLVPSPAYQAAILGALRAIMHEEVARQEQERADDKRWDTPAFWIGSVGLLIVGALYTFFAGWQLSVIRKQVILQFRPHLIVRNVVVKRRENTIPPTPLFERGMPVSGQFYISNIGGTPARIIEVGCWVEWYQGELPMERPYEGKNGLKLPVPVVLQPSQSWPWRFDSERTLGVEANNILLNNDKWGIIVLGWVAYKDAASIERRTAFCRRWSVDRQRFMPVADTDYQHEE